MHQPQHLEDGKTGACGLCELRAPCAWAVFFFFAMSSQGKNSVRRGRCGVPAIPWNTLPRLSHGRKQQNCGFRRAGKIDLRIRFHLHVQDVRPGQGASLSSELGVLRERCAWAGCALRWVRVRSAPTNVLPLGGLTTENLSISHLFGRSC